MRILMCLIAFWAAPVWAEGEKAGDFDYYVLSLSWSPNWCLREGAARGSPQCDADRDFGWVLHGLWPQFETGWPSYCRTSHRDATRGQTNAMADIMGTSGLAWHQWKKHGRCSGLSADAYFAASRQAYDTVVRPKVFRKLERAVTLPASLIEDAFLQANPALNAEMVTVTCKANAIQEVRLCLTKDLTPRQCGADVRRDCSLDNAHFAPIP